MSLAQNGRYQPIACVNQNAMVNCSNRNVIERENVLNNITFEVTSSYMRQAKHRPLKEVRKIEFIVVDYGANTIYI